MNGNTNAIGGAGTAKLQYKKVTPTANTQLITADEGYDGLGSVTVESVGENTNLKPENIKRGVEIFGVTGNFSQFPEEPTGGIYFSDEDGTGNPTKCTVYKWRSTTDFDLAFTITQLKQIEEVEFIDCNFQSLKVSCFQNTNLKKIKFTNTPIVSLLFASLFGTAIEELIIPNGVTGLYDRCAANCKSLKTVRIPNTVTTCVNTFDNDDVLEFVTLENGFNGEGLKLSSSTRYSVDTIVSWFEALADRTGESTYTLTLGAVNLAKLTEEQIAIATDKNWTLA